mmetsp:Transcript_42904/g.104913  ORF Transcript_42904/g.104913 Transcript_42904/m.104913 type:complete len:218 (+) Transcript_42904:308-961(+)
MVVEHEERHPVHAVQVGDALEALLRAHVVRAELLHRRPAQHADGDGRERDVGAIRRAVREPEDHLRVSSHAPARANHDRDPPRLDDELADNKGETLGGVVGVEREEHAPALDEGRRLAAAHVGQDVGGRRRARDREVEHLGLVLVPHEERVGVRGRPDYGLKVDHRLGGPRVVEDGRERPHDHVEGHRHRAPNRAARRAVRYRHCDACRAEVLLVWC